jgi:flavodoxin
MKKTVVAYFSATGVTEKIARRLAGVIGADLIEITPEVPYTKADLNWMDKNSRSTIEMRDKASRPALASPGPALDGYDTVFVGVPIWWYVAPTIVNSYLEAHDLTGKTVIPFATSGGSGMGRTNELLAPSCKGARLLEGRLLNRASEQSIKAWVETLDI